jgi:hypothetical protein
MTYVLRNAELSSQCKFNLLDKEIMVFFKFNPPEQKHTKQWA